VYYGLLRVYYNYSRRTDSLVSNFVWQMERGEEASYNAPSNV